MSQEVCVGNRMLYYNITKSYKEGSNKMLIAADDIPVKVNKIIYVMMQY